MKATTARVGAAFVAGTIAISLAATPALAVAEGQPAVRYSFRKLDNATNRTFNQLFGINNHNKIAGYYGSGRHGHPNKGYLLSPPYGQANYHAENFPGSAQTQVTGLNNNGVTVGLFYRTNKASLLNAFAGFYLQNGQYHRVVFPTRDNFTPSFNELVGINDSGIAIGDFADSLGSMHGYRLNINTHRFAMISIRNSASVTATGINAGGTVVGFFTNGAGKVVSFLRRAGGKVVILAKPNADMTQAFGISKGGLVVGAYTIGNNTFGFTWTAGHGFREVDDPNGIGSTVLTGVNNGGDIVGFYTDSRGNTNGLLAIP
jgi:hypothetical protein